MIDQQIEDTKGLKILIADDVHGILPEGLKEAGHEVLYLPAANRKEIISHLPGRQVLVIRTKTQVDREILDAGSDLRIIARAGAGLDNIDEAYAAQKNIICINAGEANADAVGEHSLGLLLMLMHHLSRAHAEVKNGIWLREANRGVELKGKTIAIIGYGNTGKAFSQKLKGLGMEILAFDTKLSGFGSKDVKESDWDEILEKADIVSFHVPLKADTFHYFNDEKLSAFKKNIYLLNLSRGKVVDTRAVVNGLKSGKLIGAALDVLENEDLKNLGPMEREHFEFLAGNPNIVLTPHIGGWTKESYEKISAVLLDKLLTLSLKLRFG